MKIIIISFSGTFVCEWFKIIVFYHNFNSSTATGNDGKCSFEPFKYL